PGPRSWLSVRAITRRVCPIGAGRSTVDTRRSHVKCAESILRCPGQYMVERILDQPGVVVQLEFCLDVALVKLDRALYHTQPGGDFTVFQPLRQTAKNLQLSIAQDSGHCLRGGRRAE